MNYLGVMEVTGYYIEEDAGRVEETPYLVYTTANNFAKLETLITYLGEKYTQDSVLIINPNKQIYLTIYKRSKGNSKCLGTKKQILGEIDFKSKTSEEIFSQLGTKKAGRRFRITSLEEQEMKLGYLNHIRLASYLYPRYNKLYEKDYLAKVNEAFERFEDRLKEI